MPEPEVVQDNVFQVRFQAVHHPRQGVFKVMTAAQMDAEFDGTLWAEGLHSSETTLMGKAFLVTTHHRVMSSGLVEAWWVTVHPSY